MKKWQYFALAILVVLLAAIIIPLAYKSQKLTESEKLQNQISQREDSLSKLRASRSKNNAVRIPLSDADSDSLTRSVNRKYGFDLEIQDDPGPGKTNRQRSKGAQ